MYLTYRGSNGENTTVDKLRVDLSLHSSSSSDGNILR